MDIAKVREFVAGCPHLEDFAPVHVDYTDARPVNYGIEDGGERTVETDITGRRTKRHSYALFSRNFTAEDGRRIDNAQFNQRFQEWIERQSDAGLFPEPPPGGEVEGMWAESGVLVQYDPSTNTGLYSVQFYIVYQEATE